MKKYFRTTLFEGSNSLCDKLVTLAAKTNGGGKLTINDIWIVAKGNIIEYTGLNADMQAELIGDTTLHIDKKIGDSYETVCIIEQVEITELKETVNDLQDCFN